MRLWHLRTWFKGGGAKSMVGVDEPKVFSNKGNSWIIRVKTR